MTVDVAGSLDGHVLNVYQALQLLLDIAERDDRDDLAGSCLDALGALRPYVKEVTSQ